MVNVILNAVMRDPSAVPQDDRTKKGDTMLLYWNRPKEER